jgi:flavin-dependent dehydrogenase
MEEFGNYIHAFLPSSLPAIEFGAVTPKGNHLTCNIAGQKVDAGMMDKFLDLPMVREALPDNVDEILHHLYYFKGRFPTLPAKGIFGDRYVMIGDTAGLNRPFKGKGINSAVITGIKAAEVMMNTGISKSSFHHYMRSCRELTEDIPYGKALRFLTIWSKKFGLLDRVLKAAEHEPALQRALFNIVSGHETYKKTWRESGGFKFYFKLFLKALMKRY